MKVALAATVLAALACFGCSESECTRGPIAPEADVDLMDVGEELFANGGITFDGPAVVATHHTGQLRLQYETGEIVDVSYSFDGERRLPVAVDQELKAYVDYSTPWWTETAFALEDTSGSLIAALWSGTLVDRLAKFGKVSLRYVDSDCLLPNDGCGRAIALDLEVRADGEVIRVQPGIETTVSGYHIANGTDAFRYLTDYEEVCTDLPGGWHHGYILAD